DANKANNVSSSSTSENGDGDGNAEIATHQVGETINLDHLGSLTIEEAWASQGDETLKPRAGKVWINIKAIWRNIGKDEQQIQMHAKHLQDGQGNIYNYTETDMTTSEPDVSNNKFDTSLAAGEERMGWLGF